jgi:hypothetical protein
VEKRSERDLILGGRVGGYFGYGYVFFALHNQYGLQSSCSIFCISQHII